MQNNGKELTDPDEIAKRKDAMKQMVVAERKMKREARRARPGCAVSLFKFTMLWAVIAAVVYAVYLWHPWRYATVDSEEPSLSECGGSRGYRTATTLEVLGVPVRTTDSVICVDP